MNDSRVKYYHSSDPLENFKIRVTVREISRLQTIDSKGAVTVSQKPLFSSTSVLDWQEKLYSPGEVSTYIKQKAQVLSSNQTERQKDLFRNLSALEKTTKTGADTLIDDIVLYTYVDKDHYVPLKEPPTNDASGSVSNYESYLRHANENSAYNPQDSNFDTRSFSIFQRLRRDRGLYKDMHICLATDVDVINLKNGTARDHTFHYEEHILCSIRYHENGLIEISPGLSDVLEEPLMNDKNILSAQTSETIVPLAANISDDTVIQGVKKGFRLATYRLKSAKGSEFEYAIENMNENYVPSIIDKIRVAQLIQDSKDMAANMGLTNDEDLNWKQDPPPNGYDRSVVYYAEIVSGYGFEENNCYVVYQVQTPSNWLLRTGNLADGVAEKDFSSNFQSKISSEPTASDILLNDGYADGPEGEGMLHGATAITTHSSFQAFGVRLPQQRPNWKGKSIGSLLPLPSRLLIGLVYFIITIFALILGFDYPFWIIPGLVIFISLYTGTLGSPVIQVAGLSGRNSSSSTRRSRGKQDRVLLGNYFHENMYHFNHLINLSFDVKDLPAEVLAGKDSSPTILFQVFSISWFDRHHLEGYGYFKIPDQASSIDVEVKTWKPDGGLEFKMREHFLGCSSYLQDISYVGIPSLASLGGMSKFGLRSEPGGTIRFRCNTLVTNPKVSKRYIREEAERSGKALSKETASQSLKQLQVRQTVEDILQNYRISTGRASRISSISKSASNQQIPARTSTSAFGSSVSTLSTSLSSGVPAILEPLKASERADRVAQILALAKAKATKSKFKENNVNSSVDQRENEQKYNAYATESLNADRIYDDEQPLLGSISEGKDIALNNTESSLGSSNTRIELPSLQGNSKSRKNVRYQLDDDS